MAETLSATSFSNSVGLINSITLISALVGAFVFGRIADVFGRKKIYGLEAGLSNPRYLLYLLGTRTCSARPDRRCCRRCWHSR